ncbi:hypothetical protein M0813_25033 [Anaeramoeba flamelloides]|uniref:Uncharacterized protein n=1 Tax=Anaeramoeba flamelloides TaxID=1746091 RepID=A0AAV8A497_9EUKA|nr:hypothetical protein M0812_00895 [Anaeramoeba flamelloides]KAJ6239571.1 hypothetical protein M0813_25033 [Anaeramoeba flamelloides]
MGGVVQKSESVNKIIAETFTFKDQFAQEGKYLITTITTQKQTKLTNKKEEKKSFKKTDKQKQDLKKVSDEKTIVNPIIVNNKKQQLKNEEHIDQEKKKENEKKVNEKQEYDILSSDTPSFSSGDSEFYTDRQQPSDSILNSDYYDTMFLSTEFEEVDSEELDEF